MRSARCAALRAPHEPTPSVPTGTPGGICTVASSASKPRERRAWRAARRAPAAALCAAIAPGEVRRAAGAGDDHLAARARARAAPSRAAASGVRCAERTTTSLATPNSASTRAASSITGRSRLAAHHDADPRTGGFSQPSRHPRRCATPPACRAHVGGDVAAAAPAASRRAASIAA